MTKTKIKPFSYLSKENLCLVSKVKKEISTNEINFVSCSLETQEDYAFHDKNSPDNSIITNIGNNVIDDTKNSDMEKYIEDEDDIRKKIRLSYGKDENTLNSITVSSMPPNEFVNTKKSDIFASDTSDTSDEGMFMDVEKQSFLVEENLNREKKEAEKELKHTISHHSSIYHLPSPEELLIEQDRVVPPSDLQERIESILEVLSNFRGRRNIYRSRTEYLDVLTKDMSELFGYIPELIAHFLSMFGPDETYKFIQSNEETRPLTIRTNTLKVRRRDLASSLIKRGVALDPLANWSKVGLKITDTRIPIGATPEYLSGHYMIQCAASLCPVLALNPSFGDNVLDMCASPGGKTSYMAQLMKNGGSIIANDINKERQKATIANIHRLGVKNVIVSHYDGRKLCTLWKNTFDKILLDAPCSGLGIISRDPSIKLQRTMINIKKNAMLQKDLLLSAVDTLKCDKKKEKESGVLVYSTCSVSVMENEEVINYILRKRNVKLINSGLEFGKPGFTRYKGKNYHPSLSLTRRFYPHVHNMDGFFMAKLIKLSDEYLDKNCNLKEDKVRVGIRDKSITLKNVTTRKRDDESQVDANTDLSDKNYQVNIESSTNLSNYKMKEKKHSGSSEMLNKIYVSKKLSLPPSIRNKEKDKMTYA